MSGAGWYMVSCEVRLSEVGFSEFRKPQVSGVHKTVKGDAPRAILAFTRAINSRWEHQVKLRIPR